MRTLCAACHSHADEPATTIAEFDTTTGTPHSACVRHVGARAGLTAVTEECVALVGVLDGLMTTPFHGDAENLAAWERARNVLGPFAKKGKKDTPVAVPTSVSEPEQAV